MSTYRQRARIAFGATLLSGVFIGAMIKPCSCPDLPVQATPSVAQCETDLECEAPRMTEGEDDDEEPV